MTERLMGVETEYAFAAFKENGSGVDRHQALNHIECLAGTHLPHLQARGQRGIFLTNGSRFYRDYGGGDAHQEFTTPECTDPADVVRYILAGERILLDLAAKLLDSDPTIKQALYFKHNVDYCETDSTWGLHENYLTRTPIDVFPPHIVPHLVSRIIFTGAGGFNPRSTALAFTLSPRVCHLMCAVSSASEHSRPIFHTRDEPLSGNGHRRLHVICGESLCSHLAMYLRSATTALVVALVDAGVNPGHDVSLVDPLDAMRTFASDPTCKSRVRTKSGRQLTAIEIQRHYLSLVEAHLSIDIMPPWATRACHQWRSMLERIEQGAPDSVADTLDWAIKYSLFRRHAEARGRDWKYVSSRKTSQLLATWRQELFEIDIRYGQLGEKGIFHTLDRAGVLQHRCPGVDNIERALTHPPTTGRARIRGETIKQLAGDNGRYSCDWTGIWDEKERRMIDLSNPFETNTKWKRAARESFPESRTSPVDRRLARARQLYFTGRFEAAYQCLRPLESGSSSLDPSHLKRFLRTKAWIQCRRGYLDCLSALDQLYPGDDNSAPRIEDYLVVLRFCGLTPRDEIDVWIQRGLTMAPPNSPPERLSQTFCEHWGNYLLSRGKISEAERVLQSAYAGGHYDDRLHARTAASLANAKRILGKSVEALALLEPAQQTQRQHGFEGDLADITLLNLVKLASRQDRRDALRFLREAKRIQVACDGRMGLARTLLLEARVCGNRAIASRRREAVMELRQMLPALADCKLLTRILERWDAWTSDLASAENGDTFWGL